MTYTPQHGKGGQIFYDVYDVSQYFSQVSAPESKDEVETTTFGATAKTYLTGYRDAKLTASGFYDQTTTVGSDPLLSAGLGAASDNVLTYLPGGATTVGNTGVMCQSRQLNYEIDQSVADAVKVKAEWRGDGGFERIYNLHNYSTAETGTGNFATVALPAAITMTQAYGSLHVTAFTGTSMVVKIQYSLSATPGVWVDLITFTTVTAPTKEFKSSTGLNVATVANLRGMIFAYTAPGSTTFALTGVARV